MQRWNSNQEGREEVDLEKRLTAYYGPKLREQPLPASSWENVHRRLAPQRTPGHRFRVLARWRRSRASVPAYIQDAFVRIAYEARTAPTPSMLRCTFKTRVREPAVHVSPLGRPTIRLTLPAESPVDPGRAVGQAELDVLLATGLARYRLMRRPSYWLLRLLCISVGLMGCIALALFWKHSLSLVGIPIAMALLAGAPWLLDVQQRATALAADSMIVQWLGRGNTCQGLHALASQSCATSQKVG